jgi:uncharacterized membrane protein YcjF (UPF0283 family)
MAEAIAVAGGDHRHVRRHRGDERRRGRRARTVMRHDEHVGRKAFVPLQHFSFGRGLDVAGQKHLAARARDAKHARAIVGLARRLVVRRCGGMHDLERDTVPRPVHACRAAYR